MSTELLQRNAYDQQVWWVKCRALTNKNWLDDTEVEEEGIAEMLLDDNATAALPRPGTSLNRPQTNSNGPSPAVRCVPPLLAAFLVHSCAPLYVMFGWMLCAIACACAVKCAHRLDGIAEIAEFHKVM